jgi:hypothetical protein
MPGQPYGAAPAPQKTNGPAVASLVCGILGCVPFITSLAAIVLGIVGIKKTKDPRVGGKGLAIAGLILGVLGLGMWGLFGGGIFALIKGTETQREVARQFLKDLSAGNIEAAMVQTNGGIPREDVVKLSEQMKAWGPMSDATIMGVSAEPGKTQVGGVVTFGTTAKAFEAVVVRMPDGSYKIAGLHFQDK